MSEHDHARSTDAAKTQPPARKPTVGTPLQGLLALQAGAGNAAVVQMLRQAGHPWAQKQHQHDAGCGHQNTAQPPVQRSTVHDVLRTSGRPLDEATRSDMEARLGADFADVRIHDDAAAKASAAEIGARAYTSGSHVVIGEGGDDRHTLAHELTHVIQQRHGPVSGTDTGDGLKVSDPSDRFELEAEANATRALAGPSTAQQTESMSDTEGKASKSPGSEGAQVQRMPEMKDDTDEGEHTHIDPVYPGLQLIEEVDLQKLHADEFVEIFRILGTDRRLVYDNEEFVYVDYDAELATYTRFVKGEHSLQANLRGSYTPLSDTTYHYSMGWGINNSGQKLETLSGFHDNEMPYNTVIEVSVESLLSTFTLRPDAASDDDPRTLRLMAGMEKGVAIPAVKIQYPAGGAPMLLDGNHRIFAAHRAGLSHVPCAFSA
ncbi:eCIS core domain-containing protein [Streptomyces sp. NPDC054849]